MAQLVARLNGIQKVRGSNPLSSTKRNRGRTRGSFSFYIEPFISNTPYLKLNVKSNLIRKIRIRLLLVHLRGLEPRTH